MTARLKKAMSTDDGKRNITMVASVLALLVSLTTLGGLIFKVGGWQASTDIRLSMIEQAEAAKSTRFITRGEWDQANIGRDRQLKAIEDTAKRTEDRVEKIYDILRTR